MCAHTPGHWRQDVDDGLGGRGVDEPEVGGRESELSQGEDGEALDELGDEAERLVQRVDVDARAVETVAQVIEEELPADDDESVGESTHVNALLFFPVPLQKVYTAFPKPDFPDRKGG